MSFISDVYYVKKSTTIADTKLSALICKNNFHINVYCSQIRLFIYNAHGERSYIKIKNSVVDHIILINFAGYIEICGTKVQILSIYSNGLQSMLYTPINWKGNIKTFRVNDILVCSDDLGLRQFFATAYIDFKSLPILLQLLSRNSLERNLLRKRIKTGREMSKYLGKFAALCMDYIDWRYSYYIAIYNYLSDAAQIVMDYL